MTKEDFENSPWCAYAEGKQAWKADGNYYTAEELAEMDKSNDVEIYFPQQVIMDGN
jgi:hypothetical protein